MKLLGVLEIISAIERTFASCEVIDDNECESALEAVGQLGSCMYPGDYLCFMLAMIASYAVP